jgi:hypothetical protein
METERAGTSNGTITFIDPFKQRVTTMLTSNRQVFRQAPQIGYIPIGQDFLMFRILRGTGLGIGARLEWDGKDNMNDGAKKFLSVSLFSGPTSPRRRHRLNYSLGCGHVGSAIVSRGKEWSQT